MQSCNAAYGAETPERTTCDSMSCVWGGAGAGVGAGGDADGNRRPEIGDSAVQTADHIDYRLTIDSDAYPAARPRYCPLLSSS
eukprot:scaffold10222_cov135-Isochrysis_galbana.AAC.8